MSSIKSQNQAQLPPEMLQKLQMAAAHEKRGDFVKALAICEELLQGSPNHSVLLHYIGTLYLHMSQPQKALEYLQTAIKKNPQQALSYNYAGIACCQMQNLEKGISYYKEALKINPQLIETFYNLGIALAESEKFEEAEKYLRKAEKNNFNTPTLFYNLGYASEQLEKFDEALEYYNKALALNPKYEKCAKKLAEILLRLNRCEEALEIYQKLHQINPCKESHKNLGITFGQLKKHQEATEHLEKAYDDKDETIFLLLANNYSKVKQYEKQIQILKKGLELFPKNLVYLITLNSAYREHCIWDELDYVKDKLLEWIETDEYLYKEPYYYIIGYSLEEELRLARKIGTYYQNKLQDRKEKCNFSFPRKRKSKLRIGYLSGNVKNHANTHGTVALFPNHNRDQFEIFLYSAGKRDESIYAKSIIASVDHFVDFYGEPLSDSAKKIHGDDIDVLVDLTGYHNFFSTSLLALHPGKIQIGFSGHCGTRGADFIDYMFTDKTVVKENENALYHEKLIHLPHTHFIANINQEIDTSVTRQELELPQDTFIFTCFNLSIKYDTTSFKSWMNILKKVPNSILLLWTPKDNEFTKINLRKTARKHGVEEERILFAKAMDKNKHLGRLQNLDLFLDAFTCTAHVTCIDAMLAHLPVVTLYGHNVSSRGASSILKAINMPELIAYSIEEYEEKAIHYATHPQELAQLKQKIAKHIDTTPLFNAKEFVSNLEKGYLKAWDLFLQKKSPETIYL